MKNYWIIWLCVSMFMVGTIGLYKKFVTTKLSGKVLIVDRLSMKTVRITILVATAVFAVLLGVDNLIALIGHTNQSLWFEILYWIFVRLPIIVVVTICYRFALCFVYNKAREVNEEEIKEELSWRQLRR